METPENMDLILLFSASRLESLFLSNISQILEDRNAVEWKWSGVGGNGGTLEDFNPVDIREWYQTVP